MESNSLRLPAVLSHLNMNIQDDVNKKTNALSLSNSIKNSPSSSEIKKEAIGNVDDQENTPPSVESTSPSPEDVIFKKPLPRAAMPKEDCTINSVIDELNHLKLGATPVKTKRFNFFKWTTPLKSKAPQSDDSCASSECSTYDKSSHFPLLEKPVEDLSANKSDKETSTNQNDDPDAGSDYYDCGEEGNTVNEPACISEISSDVCNTANSSFHSVSEKEYENETTSEEFAVVKTHSELVHESSRAEINRTQNDDQAFILEKYLTEQDFKLEISLSEMSFNSAINNIDIDSSKRESICIQTDNTISGSLFNFEEEKKPKFCLTEPQNLNDVTIQPDQFSNVPSFTNESEPQTEDSLFNLITDYMVQNETQTSFDLNREANMFTLSRISEAALLNINTIEEEDALLQQTPRKSLLYKFSNVDSNENDAKESEIKDDHVPAVSVSKEIEVKAETVDEYNEPDVETAINEISSNLSRVSISAQRTNVDQTSNETADPTEKTSSPSSMDKTIDTESTHSSSLVEKSTKIDDSETGESDFKQDIESSTFNQTVDLEISQHFSHENSNRTVDLEVRTFNEGGSSESNQIVVLEPFQQSHVEIDDEILYPKNSNETVNLEETRTINEGGISAANQTFNLEASQHLSLEIENENSNKTATLEEIRTLNDGEMLESNQAVDLEIIETMNREVEIENSKEICLDPLVLNQTSSSTALEKFYEKVSERSLHHETSIESITLDVSPAVGEILDEQRHISNANQTVNLDVVENIHGKPDNNDLDESVELETTPSIDETPTESLAWNQTVAFDLETTRVIGETSPLVTPELGDEKICERSLNHETSIESITFETNAANGENSDEQCKMASANQTVNLDIVEDIRENKLDSNDLDEPVNLETTSTIDEIPAESMTSNQTISFDSEITRVSGETSLLTTAEVEDEKMRERSLHQEMSIESSTLEAMPTVIVDIPERSQMSKANQTVSLDIVEVINENKSDSNEFDEPVNLETISKMQETHAESLASDRTVTFDLEVTRVIGEEIAQHNESIIDQSGALLGTSQSEFLENFRLVETKVDTIAESGNLNRTFDIDSSVPIEPPTELNEAVNSEDARIIDEKINNISICHCKPISSELKTVENDDSEETTKIDTDFTLQTENLDKQKETVNLDYPATIESEPCVSLPGPSKLNETITMYEDSTQIIPYSPEPVGSTYDPDIYMEIEEISPGRSEIVTDIYLKSTEMKINVMPTPSTETIFKNSPSRFEIGEGFSTTEIKKAVEDLISNEVENLNISSTMQLEDTVMIQGSPCPRRSDSPCQFDVHAIPSNEPASPIPPNSPTELSNKWRTQIDLSSVADHLECITGRDSPSNSSDELDITDPVESNLAPEMLQIGKLPPGINRSYSNLESIPEMNEFEEPNLSEKDVNRDTKDQKPLEISAENSEPKPESILNLTTTSISSKERLGNDIQSSTQIPMSSETEFKLESGVDKSIIIGAPLNTTDMIFKTPIVKLPQQSDLSALNDSSFNADYCCARTASAKANQSFRQSLISPKHSFLKGSTPIYSPFCTPSRKMRQTTPKASGEVPPSLLDLSIGYFVKCSATQVGSSELPEADVNKTIDVDEEQPQHEETKLLYLDEPSRKVNVKTQTHDTELSDLRAENAKLKEDLNALMELAQATVDNEVELKKTLQAIAHNEAELKETVRKLEDNNRILNNKYELLTQYSNELLARRNKELDEAEEKIQNLQIKLNSYSKKPNTEASSK